MLHSKVVGVSKISLQELTLPSKADVLSRSFCVSCRRNVISVLTPLISAVRVAMEVLQEVTDAKMSCSVGPPTWSEVEGSRGLKKISPRVLTVSQSKPGPLASSRGAVSSAFNMPPEEFCWLLTAADESLGSDLENSFCAASLYLSFDVLWDKAPFWAMRSKARAVFCRLLVAISYVKAG